jgi:GTP cyclohydrolase II
MEAYGYQDAGYNTYEANRMVGETEDARDYTPALKMLELMNITKLKILSNNPKKSQFLLDAGFDVQGVIGTGTFINKHNQNYLTAKKSIGGHHLNLGIHDG